MTALYSSLVAGIRYQRAEDGDTLYRAARGSLRSWRTWLLPLLGLSVASVIPFTMFLNEIDSRSGGDLILSYFLGRIVVVDYLIFIIAWVCGWEAASRFRRAPERLEELLVTPLQPKAIGAYFMGGGPLLWFYGLMIFSVVEALLFLSLFIVNLPHIPEADPKSYLLLIFSVILALASTVVFPLIALFQLETIRIAYWMFARAAITRTSLFRIATLNLFIIPIYVFGLTFVGMMITVFSFMGVSLVGGGLFVDQSSMLGAYNLMVPLACLAPVPGLLLVLMMKRAIAYAYSLTFEQSLLYHSWWGSSERDHPAAYPKYYHDHFVKWRVAMNMKETPITPPSR